MQWCFDFLAKLGDFRHISQMPSACYAQYKDQMNNGYLNTTSLGRYFGAQYAISWCFVTIIQVPGHLRSPGGKGQTKNPVQCVELRRSACCALGQIFARGQRVPKCGLDPKTLLKRQKSMVKKHMLSENATCISRRNDAETLACFCPYFMSISQICQW